jgi:hypothetical protein
MAPRNPSELARLEDDLKYYKKQVASGVHHKKTKEALLRRVRDIEGTLGIESKPYNSDEFSR